MDAADTPLRHVADPTSLVVDSLAVHRLTRFATADKFPPAERARDTITEALGDSPWARLPHCPWCLGLWIAFAVTAGHAAVVSRWGERGHRAWTLAALPWALSSAAGLLTDVESR